jgi:hypothetical protein
MDIYDDERFLRLAHTWSLTSDERIRERLRARADELGAQAHVWDDETEARGFTYSDVAMILDEARRLWRLERRIERAAGPPTRTLIFNRKTGKLEPGPNDRDD